MSQHTEDAHAFLVEALEHIEEQKLESLHSATLEHIISAAKYLTFAIEDLEKSRAPLVCGHSQMN
jgi:hypothetical protein